MTWPGSRAMCRARRACRGPPVPGCAVRPAWCHRGRAARPRGARGVRWRGRSVVAGAAVRPAGKALHAQKLPVPGVCPVCGALPVRDARAGCPCPVSAGGAVGRARRGNLSLRLAPVCSLSQPNRMQTGARYEYRSLISRISQPTFAKMARSPNFLGQWRRGPEGDGPQSWQSA